MGLTLPIGRGIQCVTYDRRRNLRWARCLQGCDDLDYKVPEMKQPFTLRMLAQNLTASCTAGSAMTCDDVINGGTGHVIVAINLTHRLAEMVGLLI